MAASSQTAMHPVVQVIMTSGDVHKVAQGGVWSGRDAMRHGLVDSMGSPTQAIAEARRLAGLTEDNHTIYDPESLRSEKLYEYRPLRFFSDLDLPNPEQAMTARAGIYADKHMPRLAFDAPSTLASRADALAVSAVSAATGCLQNLLVQAVLGSQQGHMRSIAVLGLMQHHASQVADAARGCIEWRWLCCPHCRFGQTPQPSTKSKTTITHGVQIYTARHINNCN